MDATFQVTSPQTSPALEVCNGIELKKVFKGSPSTIDVGMITTQFTDLSNMNADIKVLFVCQGQ